MPASTIEEKLQNILGAQTVQICAMQTEVERLRDRNAELEEEIKQLKSEHEKKPKLQEVK